MSFGLSWVFPYAELTTRHRPPELYFDEILWFKQFKLNGFKLTNTQMAVGLMYRDMFGQTKIWKIIFVLFSITEHTHCLFEYLVLADEVAFQVHVERQMSAVLSH